MSKFLPFGEALVVAQSLNLANRFEWQQWCKEGMRPPNVPANPSNVYKNAGWQGWVHWLGTASPAGAMSDPVDAASTPAAAREPATQRTYKYVPATQLTYRYVPFAEALRLSQALGLRSLADTAGSREDQGPPD